MSKLKELLSSIERNKNKILKIFIFCSAIKFIFSLLYRICSIKDSRTQFESTTNIYCLFLIGLVLIQEFLACFVPNMIQDNLKVIGHNRGKGTIFILVSIIYMSPTLDDQQNYSAYMLFIVGIFLMVANCGEISNASKLQEVPVEKDKASFAYKSEFTPMESTVIPVDCKNVNLCVNKNEFVVETKKAVNPYDIPDDF